MQDLRCTKKTCFLCTESNMRNKVEGESKILNTNGTIGTVWSWFPMRFDHANPPHHPSSFCFQAKRGSLSGFAHPVGTVPIKQFPGGCEKDVLRWSILLSAMFVGSTYVQHCPTHAARSETPSLRASMFAWHRLFDSFFPTLSHILCAEVMLFSVEVHQLTVQNDC